MGIKIMKCFVYILFIAWSFNTNCVKSESLDKYLKEKSLLLKNEFSQKQRVLSKRDIKIVDIENNKENIFPKLNDYIKMVTRFNKTLLISNNDVYEMLNDSAKLALVSKNYTLEEVAAGDKITYIKEMMFHNRSFIITKLELTGEAHIYISSGGKYNRIQTLFVPVSTDAHFFINNQNLYLLVANNKGDNLAVTSVYKWLGFHFDEIQTVFTSGAIKVCSFTTRTAEIIIILQDISNRTVVSFVYEFNNDEIRKTQFLKTIKPTHLDVYTSQNKNFLIIYSQSKKNTIYRWNGYELVISNSFTTENVIHNSIVLNINHTSLTILPSNDKVQIYSLRLGIITMETQQQFGLNFNKILDIHRGLNENVYVLGLGDNNKTVINTFSVKLNNQTTDASIPEKEQLRECFVELEVKVDTMQKRFEQMQPTTPSTEDFDQENEVILAESLVKEPEIEDQIKELKVRLTSLHSTANNYTLPDKDNLIVNGEVKVTSRVVAETLKGNNVIINSLNEEKWTPEQWLKYEEPQTITGVPQFKFLTIDHLKTTADNPVFNGMVLKIGNQIFSESVIIRNLRVNDMHAKTINDVNMDELYVTNKPQQIKGVKTFNTLSVFEARTKSLNEETPDSILSAIADSIGSSSGSDFDFENVEIENLEVDSINGVPWEKLKNSVFRVNVDKEIKGPLNLITMKANHLMVKKLNGIDTDTLFTTTTDQNITANVKFNTILVDNITAETVNKMKFLREDLLYKNETELIAGPVSFDKTIVRHNLNLTADSDSFIKKDGQVLGIKQPDLIQIYSGKVTINGDIFLKDLSLLQKTKLIISDIEVDPNLMDVYWSKDTPQDIPVQVNFQTSLSVPNLMTEVLNNVTFERYFLNNDSKQIKTDVKFTNVTVLGNVILTDTAQHMPDLKRILENGIKRTGSQSVHGRKTFTDTLKVGILQIPELDGINVTETLNNVRPKNVTGTKTIKNLLIENDAVSVFNGINTVNNHPPNSFRKKFMFIDKPQNISRLDFKFLNVTNLHVKDINSHNLDEYHSFNKIFKNGSIIENLTIYDNITIDHVKNMSSLNNISYETLIKNALHMGDKGILNEVKFSKTVKVKNLVARFINDIDFKNVTEKLLTRDSDQNITAPFNFTNIKTENLSTPRINNISVEHIVNTRSPLPQKIFSPHGVIFSKVKLNTLEASNVVPCNLDTIKQELADPPTQEWTEVEIKGNVTLLDDKSLLYRVFEKAVKQNSPNIIHSPVNISASVLMKNLITRKLINGINIPDLLEDAIFSESDKPQVIDGIKWFDTLRTKNALVLDNVDTLFINKEDVTALNEIIVNKNDKGSVIKGMKTFFAGLQTDKLNTKVISNMDPKQLVSLIDPKLIPEAIFDRFKVKNNLNIKFYDTINFTDVLDNRLVIDKEKVQEATGIYFFENLDVQNLLTQSINNINVDDIVFDIGMQNISSIKNFVKPIDIIGNATIDFINGINVTDRFNMAVPFDKPVNITGSVTILKPSFGNGTIDAKSINGESVSLIKKILSARDDQLQTDEIFNLKSELAEKVQKTVPISQKMPGEFLYLEKSNALQINVPNAVRASTTTSNDYVLIHVNGHESGASCGLPNNCTCPSQYTVEISPHFSVSMLPNKGSQRMFTYDDGKCTITFVTNSVSTSSICRTSKTSLINEVSMLSWTTKTKRNVTGTFHHYDKFFAGYISKVDFFTLNDKTYVVIGRYYDPVIDSYDLSCTVMRIGEDRSNAAEIQNIRTRGVREIYLLQTAQGVVLVLGNKVPTDIHHEQEATDIYRFNPVTEQFSLLRTVPSFGCSAATGVVIRTDSFLALAHTEAPVQVLKYQPEFDNYLFYQSFQIEDQVVEISSFYSGGFGISDGYLCLITASERYYIYSYKFLEGFKLMSTGELEGLRNLIPLQINKQTYLFAASDKSSVLLSIVKSGSN